MSNPNFLTANVAGIELMPGINDEAQGYDVNRIVQALNGTNLIPITVGQLIIPTTTSTPLELLNGNSIGGGENRTQIGFGWLGSSPNFQYQHWITTEHNAGTPLGNKIKFWTSDGTQNGVFPTNAKLGLSIENTSITVPSAVNFGSVSTNVVAPDIHSDGATMYLEANAGNFYFRPNGASNNTNVAIIDTHGILDLTTPGGTTVAAGTSTGDKIALYNSGLHSYGFGIQGNRLVAYVDSSAGNYFAVHKASGSGAASSDSTNEILIGPADGVILGPANFQINSTGGDIYVSGNSGNSVILRPSRSSGTGEAILDAAGVLNMNNAIRVPPTPNTSPAANSYGTLPVKLDEKTPTTQSISFNSIPGAFRHLLIEYSWRSNLAGNGVEQLALNMNNDGGANYAWTRVAVTGTNTTLYSANTGKTAIQGFYAPAATAAANSAATGKIFIPNYSGTSFYKTVLIEDIYDPQVAGPEEASGQWRSTSAITSIQIGFGTGSFVSGSVITLYGIP